MKAAFIVICLFVASPLFAQQESRKDTTAHEQKSAALSLPFKANPPLYVVDVKIVNDTDVSKIKTDDIEMITVLKDGDATTKWGERGRNGVVEITMKEEKVKPSQPAPAKQK